MVNTYQHQIPDIIILERKLYTKHRSISPNDFMFKLTNISLALLLCTTWHILTGLSEYIRRSLQCFATNGTAYGDARVVGLPDDWGTHRMLAPVYTCQLVVLRRFHNAFMISYDCSTCYAYLLSLYN